MISTEDIDRINIERRARGMQPLSHSEARRHAERAYDDGSDLTIALLAVVVAETVLASSADASPSIPDAPSAPDNSSFSDTSGGGDYSGGGSDGSF